MAFMVRESWIDATRRLGLGDSDWYEVWHSERGELYRELIREYGRCTGKVYVDCPSMYNATGGELTTAVGWVFAKRRRYEDSDETFLMETWVEVREFLKDGVE